MSEEAQHDFSAAQEKLFSFWKEGKFKEAEQFYWAEVFPYAEKKFLEENKIEVNYDWLIMPGGFVPEYHVFLIKTLKPKNVYFLGTPEFKEQYLGLVIEKAGIPASNYIIDVVEYKEMNLTDVYDRIRNRLSLFEGKKVVLDLSRGKRIMSVGAGIVGAFFGFDLVYMDKGWHPDFKRGVPGTEKLVMVRNPLEVFGDLELREAHNFFNHSNYGAALSLYHRINQRVIDPRIIEVEALLSEAYLYWNSFNFKAAYSKMAQTVAKVQQYNIRPKQGLMENFKGLTILNVDDVTKYNEFGDDFSIHLIVDLYTNALRKAESGSFEDAISRMYRLIELISQYRLKSHGIQTVGADISRFAEQYKEISAKLYGASRQLPYEIGLKDGYIMLYLLGDYLMEGESLDSLRQMFGALHARDTSIIAHGLQLAGEKVFVRMKDTAKKFIQKIAAKQNKDLALLIQQHTFVKL